MDGCWVIDYIDVIDGCMAIAFTNAGYMNVLMYVLATRCILG